MRIVLDTNILARAATLTSGLARDLLLRCTDNPHVLLLSEFIITEVSRVLRYARLRKVHGLSDNDIEDYLAQLRSGCAVVLLPEGTLPVVVAADQQDDPVVATAIAGQASVLCSLDRHLHEPEVVAYCRTQGIEVLRDIDLMRRIRESDENSEKR